MEQIGWIGSILLAFCGMPQAWQSWKMKNSDGLSWGFLVMWGMGEVFTILYVLPNFWWPLIFNYSANLLFVGIIIYFKVFPSTSLIKVHG